MGESPPSNARAAAAAPPPGGRVSKETPPCVAADYTASDARSVHVIALDDEPAAAGAVRPPSSPGALSSSSAALDAKPLLATVPIDLGDAWVRALAAALAPRALPPPPLSSALATDAEVRV